MGHMNAMGARTLLRGTGAQLWADLPRRLAAGEFAQDFPEELVLASPSAEGPSRDCCRNARIGHHEVANGAATPRAGKAQR
jgi:hypothetical protein